MHTQAQESTEDVAYYFNYPATFTLTSLLIGQQLCDALLPELFECVLLTGQTYMSIMDVN